MLTITLDPTDEYGAGGYVLEFRHSLVSLSKWETIHKKPFFTKEDKTPEESFSYFECMLLTPNPPVNFVHRLTEEHFMALNEYLQETHTATKFSEDPTQRPSNAVVTTEQFYDWMIEFKIPWDAQDWEFDRLMTLIRIRSIKQAPAKKVNARQQMEEMKRINQQRRQQLGSTG